jgi:hypothetical protein
MAQHPAKPAFVVAVALVIAISALIGCVAFLDAASGAVGGEQYLWVGLGVAGLLALFASGYLISRRKQLDQSTLWIWAVFSLLLALPGATICLLLFWAALQGRI